MKFGVYLQEHKEKNWSEFYLDYDALKTIISKLEEAATLANPDPNGINKGTSLSVPVPTNAAGVATKDAGKRYRSNTLQNPDEEDDEVSHDDFFNLIEKEMKKIEKFVLMEVKNIRNNLRSADTDATNLNENVKDVPVLEKGRKELRERVKEIGQVFLRLEKYVNMNFTGFHKILKKHDRRLSNPCKAFYLTRLHDQSWVRGDYSDIIVTMSSIYSALRGDEKVEEKEDAAQNFVRSTRKYWVHTEDISKVKYVILQHLPVFIQKDETGEPMQVDSQLVNSVYTDNYAMELYHGRLDKTPGAIALRFRWYGTASPRKVFIERKTHRESWAGDISVKERFVVNEDQVLPLLEGDFNVEKEAQKLKELGQSASQIEEWLQLAGEITSAINSKQLKPVMRTQYMRTAFQIPYDATVRVSMDSNLCMIVDRTKDTANGKRWFRDPAQPVPMDEITRFPHAILEVKLQLEGEGQTPAWVQELLDSGMLMEVHKFSKFIHGCSVLLPEEVRAMPYWIDDSSLKDSIERSGAGRVLLPPSTQGANDFYKHLLPHDKNGNSKVALEATRLIESGELIPLTTGDKQLSFIKPNVKSGTVGAGVGVGVGAGGARSYAPRPDSGGVSWQYELEDFRREECLSCDWAQEERNPSKITTQKVEPKLFFANERTFIKWLHMAVILSGISIGVLAFTKSTSDAQYYAVTLLPISLLFIAYALVTFLWRSNQIRTRSENRWDDPFGPVLLTSLLILALTIQFCMKLNDLFENGLLM